MKRTHTTVAELIAQLQSFPPEALVGTALKDASGNFVEDRDGNNLLLQLTCADGFKTVKGDKPVVVFWPLDHHPGKYAHPTVAYYEDCQE